MKDRCIVIPAIKKNAVIPDQLVKKMAGITLIERALNTARAAVPADDIITFTDSEEISLICERAGTHFVYNKTFRFIGTDIVFEMRSLLENLASIYHNCIILRPSSPLLTWVDIENAWQKYTHNHADSLITVKKQTQRVWHKKKNTIESLIIEASGINQEQETILIESRALIILNLQYLLAKDKKEPRIIPFFLDERSIEIENYQDWWICEKLLERRHVVFVVAGYPAIGMGHVYRALMIAHEINNHKITFVCTRESELAVESVASRDYHVIRQGDEPLIETVLHQQPDLVINDFLNTDAGYVQRILNYGARCVNFEDQGPGAAIANLVINALFDASQSTSQFRCGPKYFCLRDEFVQALRNPFREICKTLLITFGGTDQHDFTGRILELVEPICKEQNIAIRVVTGPGYAHKDKLEKTLIKIASPLINFTWATNIMSKMMEGADLAICSAGRTVYELTHMRVPGIVLATHQREATHNFGRWRHGFAFAGLMSRMNNRRFIQLFRKMLLPRARYSCWQKQNSFSFSGNKERVVGLIEDQLEKTEHI